MKIISVRYILWLCLWCGFNSSVYAKDCEFKAVSFVTDFATGKLSSCKQLSQDHYLLTTNAENRPINPSPWYAFKIKLKQGAKQQKVNLTIQAEQAKSRYLPKMSVDGKVWHAIPFSVNNQQLEFQLTVSQDMFISAQEIIDNAYYSNWMTEIAQTSSFAKTNLGKSTLGRPIGGLVAQKASNTEWLLLIGRQHPPEVTGALALFSFVQHLAQDTQAMNAFLDRFNVLVIPNLNPDGVASGNWRHNSMGVDLNRDWGKFTQVETSLVKSKLDTLLTGQQHVVFALDFHSTQQDIFYTMPADYPVAPKLFSHDWLAAIKKQVVSSFVVRPKPGSSPGRGVFKQYIADEYKVHAVTFELGDNTERGLINHVGDISAKVLVEHMLKTPPEAFIFSVDKL